MKAKKQKWLCGFTALILCCLATVFIFNNYIATAEEPIRVLLDGEELVFDVQPQMINDRTMVPMRVIFEALGAKVDWDGATETVTATKGDLIVKTTIGNKIMTVNGAGKEMDVAPVVIDGRTLVPVRFISEAFGCDVDWDGNTRTVHIYSISDEVYESDNTNSFDDDNRNQFPDGIEYSPGEIYVPLD